jgi:4-amino-4-deoxy-L-arabinose transferase-like glycosyltransferase
MSSSAFCAAVSALVFIGACILLISTPWGLALYLDSIVYIGVARSILNGDGIYFLNDVGALVPVTVYPPLYSVMIAVFSTFGLDPLDGVRATSTFFFAANAALVAFIIYRATSSKIAALLASYLALSAFPMVHIHLQVLSEPMFIFLSFLGFCFLVLYLSDGRPRMRYWASLTIALSSLTRYVGIASILTGTFAILWLGKQYWKKRLIDAGMFFGLSSLPLSAWILRNYSLAGNTVSRTFGFHPPGLIDLVPATDTICQWILPVGWGDSESWVNRVIVGGLFLSLAWMCTRVGFPRSRYAQVAGLSVLIYCGFLLISWSIVDQPLYFDTRTLAFPYVGVMIVAVSIVTAWLRATRPRAKSWRWFGFDCLIITIFMAQSMMGVIWFRESYSNGLGFSFERWRTSELMKFAKTASFSGAIFSNAPDYIYTITGNRAAMIPRKIDPHNGLPNQRYSDEITEMKERLSKSNGFILYFDTESRLWFLPSKDELEMKLPLHALKTATDGTIYTLRNLTAVVEHEKHAVGELP